MYSPSVSEEQSVELWGRNELFVTATRRPDGTLLIEGQDLRGDFFPGEYEYAITVRPADVAQVVEALGGAPGDDPLPLLLARAEEIVNYGERRWLTSLGLDVEFWSRFD